MTLSITTTGSQWIAIIGTNEEVVNALMLSGIGTAVITAVSAPTAGSLTVLYES